jgi:hypothetical protein
MSDKELTEFKIGIEVKISETTLTTLIDALEGLPFKAKLISQLRILNDIEWEVVRGELLSVEDISETRLWLKRKLSWLDDCENEQNIESGTIDSLMIDDCCIPRKLLKELLDHAIESLNKTSCEHATTPRKDKQIEAIGKTIDQVRKILKIDDKPGDNKKIVESLWVQHKALSYHSCPSWCRVGQLCRTCTLQVDLLERIEEIQDKSGD